MIYYNSKILSGEDFISWIQNKGVSLIDYIIKMIIALALFLILCKILKKIIGSIQARLDKRGVDQIASHFVLNLIKYGILTLAVFTIITQLKIVEVTSIAALIASAGVGISLAMQGALSNFAGGILLLILRPFKKGDYIVIPSSNIEGTVLEIEIYYTTIRTILNETIKIPNSSLTNNSVINKKGNESRVLVSYVSVSYKADIDKALALLQEIVSGEKNVLPESTQTFVEELGESSVKIGAACTVPLLEYNNVRREINAQILKRFKDEKIEIPYNQLDVHLIK